jgi:hypothetical protein
MTPVEPDRLRRGRATRLGRRHVGERAPRAPPGSAARPGRVVRPASRPNSRFRNCRRRGPRSSRTTYSAEPTALRRTPGNALTAAGAREQRPRDSRQMRTVLARATTPNIQAGRPRRGEPAFSRADSATVDLIIALLPAWAGVESSSAGLRPVQIRMVFHTRSWASLEPRPGSL